MTRTEYQNAIRDLLDIECDVTRWLPTDESSHGFDNITVGELSPTLLSRYLTAAQKISRLAIGRGHRVPEGATILDVCRGDPRSHVQLRRALDVEDVAVAGVHVDDDPMAGHRPALLLLEQVFFDVRITGRCQERRQPVHVVHDFVGNVSRGNPPRPSHDGRYPEGTLQRGEVVSCISSEGTEIARGLVNYDSKESRLLKGETSEKFEGILGYVDEAELIHRDNLVVL